MPPPAQHVCPALQLASEHPLENPWVLPSTAGLVASWVLWAAGAATIGCMGTGIYATNGPEGVAYVVDHAKAKIVIAEDEKQLAKFRAVDAARLASRWCLLLSSLPK